MSSAEEPFPVGHRGTRPGTRIFGILAILAVVGIACVWIFMPRQYRATSIILVESPTPKAPMQIAEQTVPLEHLDRVVQDQIVRLGSDVVLQETLKNRKVMETDWYTEGKAKAKGDVGKLLDELKDDLKVSQVPNTNFVAVSFATRRAEDSATIVNTVIEKYLAEVDTSSRTKMQKDWAYYRDQTAAKLQQLRARRNELAQFVATQFRTPGQTTGSGTVDDTFRALSQAVTRLEAEKLQFKAAYENLKGLKPEQIAMSAEMRQLLDQDPQIKMLRERKLTTELDIDSKLAEAGGNEAAVKSLRASLKVIDAKLSETLAARRNDVLDYQLKSAEQAYLNATQAEVQLRDRLAEAEAQQADVDRKRTEYESIKQDVAMLEREYEQLAAFANQLGLLQGQDAPGRAHQLGVAQKPAEPDHGRQIAATAGLAGIPILYGVLLVFVRIITAMRRRHS